MDNILKSNLFRRATNACGTSCGVDYISGGDGLCAMVVNDAAANTIETYVVYSDHLGSIEVLTDLNGNIVAEQSFDAWGRYRDPNNWNYYPNNTSNNIPNWLWRGFTGHEHMEEFQLINMNGRLYDPYLGRMLSPDNYVQDASSTQAYNRYTYALNNPLKYTDPTGEFLAIGFVATATLGEFIGNGINGYGWSISDAFKSANATSNNISNATQFPIYKSNNTQITAGVDPFALGISVNVYTSNGGFASQTTVGIGMLSGPYASLGGSYSTGDWQFSLSGSLNSNSYGGSISTTYKGYGIGYGYTHYGESTTTGGQYLGSQNTGTASILWPGGSFSIENDIFAREGQDRHRTNAWELSIGRYSVGSSIYTNDPLNEGSEVDPLGISKLNGSNKHRKGAWVDGLVYSSPIWVGYKVGNSISRIGYSHPVIQDLTQNFIHKNMPGGYQHYYNKYAKSAYGFYNYSGHYNPNSLFTR